MLWRRELRRCIYIICNERISSAFLWQWRDTCWWYTRELVLEDGGTEMVTLQYYKQAHR